MAKRYGVEVAGKCQICGDEGKTEMHHIISQWTADSIDRKDLKRNPGNIVELCVPCHRLTSSHLFRRWAKKHGIDPNESGSKKEKTKQRKKAYRMKNRGKYRCNGTTKNGGSCRQRVVEKDGYCKYHADQAQTEPVDEREDWELEEWELADRELEQLLASLED